MATPLPRTGPEEGRSGETLAETGNGTLRRITTRYYLIRRNSRPKDINRGEISSAGLMGLGKIEFHWP